MNIHFIHHFIHPLFDRMSRQFPVNKEKLQALIAAKRVSFQSPSHTHVCILNNNNNNNFKYHDNH